jgi:cation:H+ antiporter
MFLIILQLLGGLALLLLGGKYLVKGSVEITKHFNISKLVVGMTVVALGTSAPELLVSVQAALKGIPEISIGNVIGSNIANVGLVLGATIILMPMYVKKETIKIDWPIMFFAFFLLWFFMRDGKLSFFEGLIFLMCLVAYIWWEIRFSLGQEKTKDEKEEQKKVFSIPVAILIIAIASVGLAYGADMLVDSASKLAKMIGISDRVISISIVALGTSLPELTASIIAALRKETDISVGNIIGSNIFNIFAILGVTAVVHPIHFEFVEFQTDLYWMAGIGIILFLSFLPFRKRYVHRIKGVILVISYFVYMAILFKK